MIMIKHDHDHAWVCARAHSALWGCARAMGVCMRGKADVDPRARDVCADQCDMVCGVAPARDVPTRRRRCRSIEISWLAVDTRRTRRCRSLELGLARRRPGTQVPRCTRSPSRRGNMCHTHREEKNAEEAAQTTSFFFFEGVLVLLHRATRVVEGERKRVCGALERSDRPRVAR